jgi:hypothetical protein
LTKQPTTSYAKYGQSITDVTCDFVDAAFEGVDLQTCKDFPALLERVDVARAKLREAATTDANDLRKALVTEFRSLMRADRRLSMPSDH